MGGSNSYLYYMEIRPVKTEEDYNKALEKLEDIFDAKRGTKESDEPGILGIMIDEYEKLHYPI